MDYATIKFIWWILVGVLLGGFAIMDGHGLGAGILSFFIGKTDLERRVIINSVAPHWDGNQVWFITLGGAIFAAWPLIYATAFSGFYIAMLAVLWTLFLRPAAFDYRSKLESMKWRNFWDFILLISSGVPAIIFGVAMGNLLIGVPFYFDNTMHVFYNGTFWSLLNPFALLCGLISLLMITFQGANYIIIKTEADIYKKAKVTAYITGTLLIILFILAGVWVSYLPGFVASNLNPNGVSNPLVKSVHLSIGGWLHNYEAYPLTMLLPITAIITILLSLICTFKNKPGLAFIGSSLAIVGIIGTLGVSMFPFLLPSTQDLNSSLTLWDCTSSELTLKLMFIAAMIFTPIIVIYTSFAYKIMRGKLTIAKIKENTHSLY